MLLESPDMSSIDYWTFKTRSLWVANIGWTLEDCSEGVEEIHLEILEKSFCLENQDVIW